MEASSIFRTSLELSFSLIPFLEEFCFIGIFAELLLNTMCWGGRSNNEDGGVYFCFQVSHFVKVDNDTIKIKVKTTNFIFARSTIPYNNAHPNSLPFYKMNVELCDSFFKFTRSSGKIATVFEQHPL